MAQMNKETLASIKLIKELESAILKCSWDEGKLKKQVSNNSYLWDQMAEAEKREKILKQELLFTQQSLAAAEKVIEKL